MRKHTKIGLRLARMRLKKPYKTIVFDINLRIFGDYKIAAERRKILAPGKRKTLLHDALAIKTTSFFMEFIVFLTVFRASLSVQLI